MQCGRLKLISDSVNFVACTACLHARYSTLQVVPGLLSRSAVTTCNDRECRQFTPDASQLLFTRTNMNIQFTVKDNLLRGNKKPTRRNRCFYCRSYCLINMPIIRSSRLLYSWLLPVVFGVLVFKLSLWCGAEGYVSGLRAAVLLTDT